MEGCDTPDKLAEYLIQKHQGIKDEVAEILRNEDISGKEFLELSETDFRTIGVKMGPVKQLVEIQRQHQLQASAVATSGQQGPHFTKKEESTPNSCQDSDSDQDTQQSMTTSQATAHSTVTPTQDTSQQVTHAIPEIQDHENRTVFHRIGKPQGTTKDSAKVLLLVGMTGVGKGTLVDALGNYLLGARTPNPQSPSSHFRQESQMAKTSSESQTSWISVYQFEHQSQFPVPFPVTIIDTPGFADTGGLNQDRDIASHMKNLLTHHFNCLDAIILVVKASDARASATQKYTLHSIQQLFGKDIKENIYVVATHSDSRNIPALEGLKEINFPFTSDKVFAVNNVFLDECAADDEDYRKLNDIIWKRNRTTYEKMLASIASTPSVTLQMTKETLLEQQSLTIVIDSFKKHLNDGVLKTLELEMTQGILKGTIDAKTSVPKVVNNKKSNLDNKIACNCQTCKLLCEYPCTSFGSKLDKIPMVGSKMSHWYCNVMDRLLGKCIVCGCPSDGHSFDSFRYVPTVETQEHNEILLNGELTTQKLQQIQQKLKAIREENNRILSKMKNRMDTLNTLSLEQSQLTPASFIDRLIQQELCQPSTFSKERVQILRDLRQIAAQL